ncbi:MAG: membrane protein insertion efficiency factor YidD [Nitrospirota bacterium]
MHHILILVVRGYQRFLSPLHPPVCRFYPTCSNYSIEALRRHGFFSGVFMTFNRILRCNPFSVGGHDPVLRKAERFAQPSKSVEELPIKKG